MAVYKPKGEKAAERLLESFRSETGVLRSPVDPIVVARSLGINVYEQTMPASVSGYIYKHPSAPAPDIFLNAQHSPVRQRFTCAHELGHYSSLFEDGRTPPESYIYKRDGLAACGTDTDEVYANQFAAALLMPRDVVIDLKAQGLDRLAVAERLHVSMDALGHRYANLGLS